MPRRESASSPPPSRLSTWLEPTLAPHDGLPAVGGSTTRFCYGIVTSASGDKPGALAAAIHKAEMQAASSSRLSKSGGGLPVAPAITPAALEAPAGTASPLGTPGAGPAGGSTTGVGGTAAGFDPTTGADAGKDIAVGEAKVAGTVAPP